MVTKESKALKVLIETLESAVSITQYYYFDNDEARILKVSFRKLANMITSPKWVDQEPDFPELYEMLQTLPERLKNAKELKYENTISCILKAVFYGLGIGCRPLTKEERRQEVMVLFQRRLEMQKYMEIIEIAENLDFWIAKEKDDRRRIGILCDSIAQEEQKMEILLQKDPYILEEVCFVTHASQLEGDAKEYFESKRKKRLTEEELDEIEAGFTVTEYKIAGFRQHLEEEAQSLDKVEIFSDFAESDIVPEQFSVLQLVEEGLQNLDGGEYAEA